MRLVIFAALLGLSCGGTVADLRVGDQCVASSECGAGLFCDDTRTPHSCQGMSLLDAFVPPVDAPKTHVDASSIDAHVTPVDAHVTPDAPPPIDAAVMDDSAVPSD